MFKSSSPYIKIMSQSSIKWHYSLTKELFHRAMEEDIIIYLHIGSYTDISVRQKSIELFSNNKIVSLLNNRFIPIIEDKEDRPESYLLAIDLLFLNEDFSNGPFHIFIMPNRQPIIAFSDSDPDVFIEIALSILDAMKNNRDRLKQMASELSKRAINTGVITQSSKISSNYFLIDNKLQKWFKETINSDYLFKLNSFMPNSTLMYSLLDYIDNYKNESYKDKLEIILDQIQYSYLFDVINGGFFKQTISLESDTPLFEKNIEEISLLTQVYILAYKVYNKRSYLKTIEKNIQFLMEINNGEGFPIAISLTDNDLESSSYYTFSLNELYILFSDRYLSVAKSLSLDIDADPKKKQIPKRTMDTYSNLSEKDISILKNREKEHIGYFVDSRLVTSANFSVIKTILIYLDMYDNPLMFKNVKDLFDRIFDSNCDIVSGFLCRYSDNREIYFLGSLSDYAAFIETTLLLFTKTNEEKYLKYALKSTEFVIKNFYKESNGMFSKSQNTSACDTIIPFKRESNIDIIRPSANSMMCGVLIDLYVITNDISYFKIAKRQLDNILPNIEEAGIMLANWANKSLKLLRVISK